MKTAFRFCAIFALPFINLNLAAATPDIGYWDSRFNMISGRPAVDVVADDNRRLIVWGQSLPVSIPLPSSTAVARWDGLKWEALAKTIPATVIARDDQVYAAGKFSSIGGVAASNIALFENGTWRPLAEGVNSNVTSIAFLGTKLVAGGSFTQAGLISTPSIAVWNGTTWSAMGGGLTGVVSRVTTSTDTAFAAWTSGAQTAISSWNGSDWQQIGAFSTTDGSAANVRAIVFVSGSLFAGGHFNSVDGQTITNIARWNGTSWSQCAGGAIQGQVESFATIAPKVFAAGDLLEITATTTNRFALAEIRESDFTKELFGEAKLGRTVTSIGSELFVVTQPFLPSLSGTDQNFFSDTFGLIWHHNGDRWGLVSNVPQFALGFHEIAECSEGLVGTITPRLGVFTNPLIWTGSRFELTEIAKPSDGSRFEIKFLIVQNGASVYAQATRFKAGEPTQDLLMSVTNRVWYPTTLPIDGQISALGLYKGQLTAAIRTVDTVEHWNVWIWNGSSWISLGGEFDGVVGALASFNGDLYAGGRPINSGNVPISRLARFDGANWSPVADGVTGPSEPVILELRPAGNKLYVGGFFQQAGSIQATNIATWDGSKWEAIPGLTNGSVSTITASSDGLIAIAGSFRYIDGLDAGGIALWNGVQWTALGANVGNSTGPNIISLLWRGHDLFAAGAFNFGFNGVLSHGFGIWHRPGVILNIQPSLNASALSVTTTGGVPSSFSLEETSDFSTWVTAGPNAIGNDRPWIFQMTNRLSFVRANFGN